VKDLLVTVETPGLHSGAPVRTYGLARALAAGGDGLDLLYVRFGAATPEPAFEAITGIRLHEVTPSRGLRRAQAYGGARLRGVPDGFARAVSRELAAEALRLAPEPDRGRVIADGPEAAAALDTLAGRRPVVYSGRNIESGFRHELDERRLGGRRSLRRFERRLLMRASESWMVSEADVAAARLLCPGARVRYVPNVVDVAAIPPAGPAIDACRAIFVASFKYEPNRTALRFLVEDVLPLVWRKLPNARLTVVGKGSGTTFDDPRIEALGYVEDLGSVYAEASCAVVPLLHGGGTPLKFVEALAHGLPVVATPRAARGLAVRDGEHCLVAEGAEEFAAALVRALRGEVVQLGRRGRALAERLYSIDALTELVRP
jgi:glycosyltransferase involved in cell wall biosynthesis